MNIYEVNFVTGAGLLVLSILAGFWLMNQGAPYKVLTSTIHKLSAVAGIVFFVLAYLKYSKSTEMSAILLTLSIVTAALLAMAVVTGGVINNQNTGEGIMIRIHNATSIGSVLSLIALVLFYLRQP